jgi:predicted  nucleic acid-binding Zn-ribbon protein
VKASPADQLRLLDLQAADTALDRLAHRRRTLPELAEIEAGLADRQGLADDVVRTQTEVGDLDRRIRKLEAEIEQVRARCRRDNDRLESGSAAARELESLQHEVAALGRRQAELEDTELELMEEREEADAAATAARDALAVAEKGLADAQARRDAAFAEIDASASGRTADRDGLAAGLPADLLGLYEKIRAASAGIGAAPLRARRCGGCRLDLAGVDLSAVRNAPEEEVLRCEECRRILVRTPESGL